MSSTAETMKCETSLWDSRDVAEARRFPSYREEITRIYTPWTSEIIDGAEFSARIDATCLEGGAFAKLNISPIIASRTSRDIADSNVDCVYANVVAAGIMSVEQHGKLQFAHPGDLIIADGTSKLSMISNGSDYETSTFMIPKSRLPDAHSLINVVVPRSAIISPVTHCISYLRQSGPGASPVDMNATFDALVSLLPVAVLGYEGRSMVAGEIADRFRNEALPFINDNLANPDITPQTTAAALGISSRYLHKMFAENGTTFMSYLTSRRLANIRVDLMVNRRLPISAVAYRWGFKELSTFSRAFKAHYGCTPNQFRSQL